MFYFQGLHRPLEGFGWCPSCPALTSKPGLGCTSLAPFIQTRTDDDMLEYPRSCSPHPLLLKHTARRRVRPPPWTMHAPFPRPTWRPADSRDRRLPDKPGHRSHGTRVDPPDSSDGADRPAGAARGTGQGFPAASHRDSRQGGGFQQPLSAKTQVRVGEAMLREWTSADVVVVGDRPWQQTKKSIAQVKKGQKKGKRFASFRTLGLVANQSSMVFVLCPRLAVLGEGLTAK